MNPQNLEDHGAATKSLISPRFMIFYFAIGPEGRAIGGRVHLATFPRDLGELPPVTVSIPNRGYGPQTVRSIPASPRGPQILPASMLLYFWIGAGRGAIGDLVHLPYFPFDFGRPRGYKTESRRRTPGNLDDPVAAAGASDLAYM